MTFARKPATTFHKEVPGARWFKADLHVHTIDDHMGGKAKLHDSNAGKPDDPSTIADYAREFLKAAVRNEVKVLGLTPHSPRAGSDPDSSAVWRIVEEWNEGNDDDGVPFREKVYAVFPGFEPAFKDGSKGLHLLFLFDPEIGRDTYLRLFDVLMGGVSPWEKSRLCLSNKSAQEGFSDLRALLRRENSVSQAWNHLVIAPHIESPDGLLGAMKSQVLQLFEHAEVNALGLNEGSLPVDAIKDRPWLHDGMKHYRQCFIHGSDAYQLSDIGKRFTWVKLASPRIEALRQAFVANDSRVRIGFERDAHGKIRVLSKPPDILDSERPWLRSVTVRGGQSFFGGQQDGIPRATKFEFSPDLTCIIGGSMTGKSTLLDGLRIRTKAPLPEDDNLQAQVEERANAGFLVGAADVDLDCPGSDPTSAPHDQWPARFYTQNELQRLADEPEAVEDILKRLDPTETERIEAIDDELAELDTELRQIAEELSEVDEEEGEAQQAFERASAAQKDVEAFAEAGVTKLHNIGRRRQTWQDALESALEFGEALDNAIGMARELELPELDNESKDAVGDADEIAVPDATRWERILRYLDSAKGELHSWEGEVSSFANALKNVEDAVQTQVERDLSERGYEPTRIKEFQALSRQVSFLNSYESNLEKVSRKRKNLEDHFDMLLSQRQAKIEEKRFSFANVMQKIESDFGEDIRVRHVKFGDSSPLDDFMKAFGQKGITRWWNSRTEDKRMSPDIVLEHLQSNTLSELGMTEQVQSTFRELMTRARKRMLATVRCPDRYVIEQRVGETAGDYRSLDSLSGGRRVSVLLSLLLKTTDERPLVIDQPEDQLDNEFLFQTVLPALKSLKGRRQIIVATHDANIVVNGDADQVIQLHATSNRGWPECSGAIEDPDVRTAIVQTVDGGDEAFRLRRTKYGF